MLGITGRVAQSRRIIYLDSLAFIEDFLVCQDFYSISADWRYSTFLCCLALHNHKNHLIDGRCDDEGCSKYRGEDPVASLLFDALLTGSYSIYHLIHFWIRQISNPHKLSCGKHPKFAVRLVILYLKYSKAFSGVYAIFLTCKIMSSQTFWVHESLSMSLM